MVENNHLEAALCNELHSCGAVEAGQRTECACVSALLEPRHERLVVLREARLAAGLHPAQDSRLRPRRCRLRLEHDVLGRGADQDDIARGAHEVIADHEHLLHRPAGHQHASQQLPSLLHLGLRGFEGQHQACLLSAGTRSRQLHGRKEHHVHAVDPHDVRDCCKARFRLYLASLEQQLFPTPSEVLRTRGGARAQHCCCRSTGAS
mmetsp:Transcript_85803/g.216382  ORF Transcript_85803/g.216382 Transcript_85803/m.216382 type:complete len:206 (-) Transcript_85803:269-886(-)